LHAWSLKIDQMDCTWNKCAFFQTGVASIVAAIKVMQRQESREKRSSAKGCIYHLVVSMAGILLFVITESQQSSASNCAMDMIGNQMNMNW
jgi:hypothetical protein